MLYKILCNRSFLDAKNVLKFDVFKNQSQENTNQLTNKE